MLEISKVRYWTKAYGEKVKQEEEEKEASSRKGRKVYGYFWEVRIIYYWLIVSPTCAYSPS